MTASSILLVEDDENDVVFMRHAFRSAGIGQALHVVSDGQDAIEYLSGAGPYANREQHPVPSLVFTDLKLAQKSGLELLAWLRSQPSVRRIPVIILSASADPREVKAAYEGGANSFLTKPSSNLELVELLRAFKNYWLGYNQF